MKITSVECYLGNFITVKVNTDEGISGFGEAGLAYGNCWEAAFGQCQDFAKLVIGMDPFNTEEIWEHLHRHTFWGMGGGVVVTSEEAARLRLPAPVRLAQDHSGQGQPGSAL